MWSIDELVRGDEAIEQKGKLPEKDFAKNELQTPQRPLMTILVSLLHYNNYSEKENWIWLIDQMLLLPFVDKRSGKYQH